MQLMTFQNIIMCLHHFWSRFGCAIVFSSNNEVGAGTLNQHTFLNVLDNRICNIAYVEPCTRPSDGRYGKNANRMQSFYQYQVILKPCPVNIQKLYFDSLMYIGFDVLQFDLKFIEDDWEHPAIGAKGLGWEVWACGMEIAQFTYFQQCGGIPLSLISCELTYGLERLSMCLQDEYNIYNIIWSYGVFGEKILYNEIHSRDEYEWSCHNFKHVNIAMCVRHFLDYENQVISLLKYRLVIPSYNYILKCSHLFNLMDSRGLIGFSQRILYISKIRVLSNKCARVYLGYFK